MVKVVKFFIGVLLLPVCVGISRALWELVLGLQPQSDWLAPPPVLALLVGLGLWLLLYYTLPRPVRSYILAHELTHALWGALMGAKIFNIKVSDNKGAVTMSENNFVITLAPYFFPLYTVLTVAAYYILNVFVDVQAYHLFWLGAVGLTWGFHLTFTISALLQHQSDIQEHGRLFSYTVIYVCNVLGIALWVVMVSSATLETMIVLLQAQAMTMSRLALGMLKQIDLALK